MNRFYTIRDLESLSGVKAHTIRIWEKRYNLLEPDRTGTNIRRYDTDQLRKVLNVALLISQGKKISKVSAYNDDQLSTEVRKLMEGQKMPDLSVDNQINQLTVAMIGFDEQAFNKLFSAVILHHGLVAAFEKVLYPFLEKIGLLWCAGEINPAMEHFITNLIRQKLFSALDGRFTEQSGPQIWLLFLPQGEYHDIGLLMSYYTIKNRGQRVIYLGQDVPFENLSSTIEFIRPTHLLSFFRTGNDVSERKQFVEDLAGLFPEMRICVGTDPDKVPESSPLPITFLHNIDDLNRELDLPVAISR